MASNSLLPPNATPLERSLEAVTARLSDIELPLAPLMDPATIPLTTLPWLAWGLSVDSWDPEWSAEAKRTAVAESIALHRRKGTRHSVEQTLARFDSLSRVVEWFDQVPRARPHTFEVHLPIVAPDGTPNPERRITAAFAERLISEVNRVKPLREHVTLVQSIAARGGVGVQCVARPAMFARQDTALTVDTSQPWDTFLQTEEGEPFEAETGQFLEDI